MIKKGCLISIVGGVFYLCLMLLWAREYTIMTVQAKELILKTNENGLIETIETLEEDHNTVLQDTIRYISEVDNELENEENNQEDYQDYQDGDNISSSPAENEEDMNKEDQFKIMVIFCFGLCAGVIVGHFLTGFIR